MRDRYNLNTLPAGVLDECDIGTDVFRLIGLLVFNR